MDLNAQAEPLGDEQIAQLSTRIANLLDQHLYVTLTCTLCQLLLLHHTNSSSGLEFFSTHKGKLHLCILGQSNPTIASPPPYHISVANVLVLMADSCLGLGCSIAMANATVFIQADRQLYYRIGLEGAPLDREKSRFRK